MEVGGNLFSLADFEDASYQYFAIRHGLYGTILQLAWYHIGQIGCSQIFNYLSSWTRGFEGLGYI